MIAGPTVIGVALVFWSNASLLVVSGAVDSRHIPRRRRNGTVQEADPEPKW